MTVPRLDGERNQSEGQDTEWIALAVLLARKGVYEAELARLNRKITALQRAQARIA